MASSSALSREDATLMATQSADKARNCMRSGEFGRAYAYFLLALELEPSVKEGIEEDFLFVLKEWTDSLKEHGKVPEMFDCFETSLGLFPRNPIVLCSMGSQLFALGHIDEAASCFRNALKANPRLAVAKQNLENVASFLVERWHFRMLNDLRRNKAYQVAIGRAISEGHNTVLDIGTGTGILSMFASQSEAKEVYACDSSKTMCQIAHDVLLENKVRERVQIIDKSSLDLIIPEDLNQKVSLVVTEILDSGLLGEGIIPTLKHAWKNLLQKNAGKVIPRGATVYIQLIECETVRKQNRCVEGLVGNLNLEGINIVSHAMAQNIGDSSGCAQSEESEPYTTEFIKDIKGGYKPLTQYTKALDLDFSSIEGLESMDSWKNNALDIELSVTSGGYLDAILSWFDLHVDQQVTLSTAPDSGSCWEQAIYPVHHSTERISVNQQDKVQVAALYRETHLNFICTAIQSKLDSRQQNLTETASHLPAPVLSLHSMEVGRLNDSQLNLAYFTAVDRFVATRKRTRGENSQSRDPTLAVDLSAGVSLAGLHALQLGGVDQVTCIGLADQESVRVVETVARVNGLRAENLKFDKKLKLEEKCDLLITDLVEPRGVFKQQALEDLAMARACMLKAGGTVVPLGITVYGVCVESSSLLTESRVSDRNTLGLKIANFFNEFSTKTHMDIELCTLDHATLTAPFKLFQFNFSHQSERGDLGDSDSPPSLSASTTTIVSITKSGTIMAVPFWFEIEICKGHTVSTLDPSSHWKQAAFIPKQACSVSLGQQLHVNATCENSCISIDLNLQ